MTVFSKLLCAVSVLSLLVGPHLVAGKAQAGTPFSGENGKIAFARTHKGISSIWTMNQNGTQQKVLAIGAHSPVWSPDGQRIAFIAASRSGQHLHIMNANGEKRRSLTRDFGVVESAPVWSPDGARLAFVREKTADGQHRNAVFTIRPGGSNEVNFSGWTARTYSAPSWSPNSPELVFEQRNQEGQRSLIIKNLTSGETRRLTDLSDDTPSEVSWAPSGAKILYTDSFNEVYTIWPDGSHRTVISDGDSRHATWSPDGERIAFLEDEKSISIREKDGNVTPVLVSKGSEQKIGAISWSPDSTKLVFTMTYLAGNRQVAGVFVVDLPGADFALNQLARERASEFSWQAK